MLSEKYYEELKKYEALINRKNEIDTDFTMVFMTNTNILY